MANELMVGSGLGLITLAVTPTPDDITIISPIVQIVVGGALVFFGLMKK